MLQMLAFSKEGVRARKEDAREVEAAAKGAQLAKKAMEMQKDPRVRRYARLSMFGLDRCMLSLQFTDDKFTSLVKFTESIPHALAISAAKPVACCESHRFILSAHA